MSPTTTRHNPLTPRNPPTMTRTDAQGRRLCTATTRAGNPCRSPAILGGMVCRMHGGSSPQAKAAAHEVKLNELVGPAMMLLRDLIRDEDAPPAVRLTAARDVLDRTGHKPPAPGAWDEPPPSHVLERWIDDLTAEEEARARLED